MLFLIQEGFSQTCCRLSGLCRRVAGVAFASPMVLLTQPRTQSSLASYSRGLFSYPRLADRVYSLLHPTPKPVTELPKVIPHSSLSTRSSFTLLVMAYTIPRPFLHSAIPVCGLAFRPRRQHPQCYLSSDPVISFGLARHAFRHEAGRVKITDAISTTLFPEPALTARTTF